MIVVHGAVELVHQVGIKGEVRFGIPVRISVTHSTKGTMSAKQAQYHKQTGCVLQVVPHHRSPSKLKLSMFLFSFRLQCASHLKTKRYWPQPSWRKYIPKDEHSKRPLGLPGLEDKIVQKGIARILEAIRSAESPASTMSAAVEAGCSAQARVSKAC
jgi:hypothetical protein